MYPMRMIPVEKDYLWGGNRLRRYGGKGGKIAEIWALSCHEAGESRVANGVLAGMSLKKLLDVSEVGGTAFIGITKPVIKAHGSSNARAIRSAVKQAIAFVNAGVTEDIEKNIDYMKLRGESGEA